MKNFFAFFLLIFIITGCLRQDDPRLPGYLYVHLKVNPSTLDPALIVDLNGAKIAAKLYNGLVGFDDSLNPVPDIAKDWTVSENGIIYSFTLRQDVTFFNGRTLTAHDIKYSFERVLNPETSSPRTWVLSGIKGAKEFMRNEETSVKGIKVKNDFKLEITLEKPFAPFISMLGLTTAYIVPREEVENHGRDYSFNPGGTGPFALEHWKHNQHILLKARDDYFKKKPELKGIYYKIIPEDFTALVEFEKGDIDVLPEIMSSEYHRFSNDPKWKDYICRADGLNTYYIGLNCQMEPFNNPLVRKALNHAIDREKIINSLLEGRGTVAKGPIPPILRGEPQPSGYTYNPDKARQLLRDAGLADGFTMTVHQSPDIETLDIMQAVQSYLSNVGIRVKIVQLEWSAFLDTVASGDAHAFWLSWWADYPDAENFLFPLFHSTNFGTGGNRARFKNENTDIMIEEAVEIMDKEKRKQMYRLIEKTVINEPPWIFLWHKVSCSIHRPNVKEYKIEPLAAMEKWTDVSIK